MEKQTSFWSEKDRKTRTIRGLLWAEDNYSLCLLPHLGGERVNLTGGAEGISPKGKEGGCDLLGEGIKPRAGRGMRYQQFHDPLALVPSWDYRVTDSCWSSSHCQPWGWPRSQSEFSGVCFQTFQLLLLWSSHQVEFLCVCIHVHKIGKLLHSCRLNLT